MQVDSSFSTTTSPTAIAQSAVPAHERYERGSQLGLGQAANPTVRDAINDSSAPSDAENLGNFHV